MGVNKSCPLLELELELVSHDLLTCFEMHVCVECARLRLSFCRSYVTVNLQSVDIVENVLPD